MKKLLGLVCVFVFLAAAAPALGEETAFSGAQARDWVYAILTQAQQEGIKAQTGADGVSLLEATEGTAEYLSGEEYLELISFTLSRGAQDARGICGILPDTEDESGTSARQVLGAYRCDNPRLEGTFEEAVLYMDGEDSLRYGLCLRDGQRILQLEYADLQGEEAALVRYVFDGDILDRTEYLFGAAAASEAAAPERLEAAAAENAYFAYPVQEDGVELDVFAREDLLLSGMDVLSLTEGKLTAMLGAPEKLETQSESGELQTVCTWPGLTVTFTREGEETVVTALLVIGDRLEGPRAVRCGDSLGSVLQRFPNQMAGYTDEGTLLYGDGEQAPYAVISFGQDIATVRYCMAEEEGAYTLYCSFVQSRLVSFLLAK